MQDITHQVNEVSERIHALRAEMPRVLVAICGAPGSGKSTLAGEVARRLRQQKCPCVTVPMDGFHLDNPILEERDLLRRKGSPESFDADGFLRLVALLTERVDVVAPRFDRSRDAAIAGAIHVPPDCPVVLVEGNYLMFDEEPWRQLADLWDLSVRIDAPMPDLRARLIQRWLSQNYSRTVATQRAEMNDIPNASRVQIRALPCDIMFDGTRE